ncbi:MAG: HAD family hydrolase [Anaerolineales bacterium]|jgi:D-glycero-D-manno-heptose 1,7-bisphosphate phosphatase
MFPAIFLDRDGVIIENREEYVRSWADVSIYPQALSALEMASHSTHKIVIITNQAGVGKGLIPLQTATEINRRLVQVIERAGGRVDGLYMCPHTPQDQCECRKPQPGMILQAARALSLDLAQSWVIGDALSDLQAGRAAGVGHIALVRTGRGDQQAQLPESATLGPFRLFHDLTDAIQHLLKALPSD